MTEPRTLFHRYLCNFPASTVLLREGGPTKKRPDNERPAQVVLLRRKRCIECYREEIAATTGTTLRRVRSSVVSLLTPLWESLDGKADARSGQGQAPRCEHCPSRGTTYYDPKGEDGERPFGGGWVGGRGGNLLVLVWGFLLKRGRVSSACTRSSCCGPSVGRAGREACSRRFLVKACCCCFSQTSSFLLSSLMPVVTESEIFQRNTARRKKARVPTLTSESPHAASRRVCFYL